MDQKDEDYINTWHVEAEMVDKFILTCYGIPDEGRAREIGKRIIDSGLVEKVKLIHTTKATSRARWVRSSAVLRRNEPTA